MISETDDQQQGNHDREHVLWALLVSGLLNVLIWTLVPGLFSQRLQALLRTPEHPQQQIFTVMSSSLNIAHHSHPEPAAKSAMAQAKAQRQQPRQPVVMQHVPKPQAQPTEIARIVPHAPPQPRTVAHVTQQATLAERLAQQQVAFEHEAQRLNAEHAPLSVATIDPNQAPAATQHFQMSISGLPGEPRRGEGVITPGAEFRADGLDCYENGFYEYQYPNGMLEEGDIPWPFCYLPRQNPFRLGIHRLAMPFPARRDYRVPAGVVLKPQAKAVYEYWLSISQ